MNLSDRSLISNKNHENFEIDLRNYSNKSKNENENENSFILKNEEKEKELNNEINSNLKEKEKIQEDKRKLEEEKYLKEKETNLIQLIEKNKIKKKTSLNANFCHIICRFFNLGSCGKNRKLNEICIKEIESHMNIFIYFKMIQEIQIIKRLLFTQDQTNFINFLARPTVGVDKTNDTELNKLQHENLNIEENEEIKLEKIQGSFRNILEEEEQLNVIDHNLIRFFIQEYDHILFSEK